jgi:putative ABC transport system substrate-binding protein
VFLALLVLIALLTAEVRAQQPPKGPQIGYLISGPPTLWTNRIEAMRTGLRDLGYVEGKNMTFVFQSAETPERLPGVAAELVRRNVDVIFATSSTEVEVARRATKTIPIVFATHADPERLGHVATSRGCRCSSPRSWSRSSRS